MPFIDYWDQDKILLLWSLAHATYTLQLLDVSLFKPLSSAYHNKLSCYIFEGQGLTPLAKRDFFALF
jgi:hypothetical protein